MTYVNFRDFLDIDWDTAFSTCNSIDEKDKIYSSIEKFIPKIEYTLQKLNKKFSTPLDHNTIRKIKKKHRAWQRYIVTKDGQKYIYRVLQIKKPS